MQGKGIIKFFLVMMALVCIWQFVLTIPTRGVENDADDYADKTSETHDGWEDARSNYLDSVSSEVVWSIPGMKDYTYQDLKNSQLALGLDLKGGMSVVMQVDLQDYLKTLAFGNAPPTAEFQKALTSAVAAQQTSQTDLITLFQQSYEAIDPNVKLTNFFANNRDEENPLDVNSTNSEVTRYLRTLSDGTVQQTYEMLKERIDRLGVVQPNLSLDASRDLIIAELPGIRNPERARAFLQSAAKLEFWKTYRNSDENGKVLNAIVDLDKRLDALLTNDTTKLDIPETITVQDTSYVQDSLGNNTTEIAEITEREAPNPELQNQTGGPLLSRLALNTSFGQGGQGSPIVGFAEGNDRNYINKLIYSDVERQVLKPELTGILPQDLTLMWAKKPDIITNNDGEESEQYYMYAIKKRQGAVAPLEGDVVTKASSGNNQGQIEVSMSMNTQGAQTWYQMTNEAYNNGGREIAIVLDNEVVSAPGVNNGAIAGGRSSISGGFTLQEADDLSRILEIGKLPARPKIIQESLVGPTLGAQNIRYSLISLAAGVGLVLLFMMGYYGGAGIVAILALLLNVFFILGSLASYGTVLTLPGLAGIVLTMGMAVDANVIIYERVREELRAGKSLLASIRDGFGHSYSAIIDANVTTLLVAAVLVYFGVGPIKGFAVVLIIGVLCSLFTAVLVGRMMIEYWTSEKGNNLTFWTGSSKNAFANVQKDWLGKRKMAYMISGAIILAGVISMATRGFEMGVDFKGGYSYTVQFDKDATVDLQTLKENLTTAFKGATPVVKSVSTGNTFAITTSYLITSPDDTAANQVMSALYTGVKNTVGGDLTEAQFKGDNPDVTHVLSSTKVGPTIADDIKRSAFYAGIFALLLIFLYIMIRFTRWEYSAGAVAALFHDVLIVLSIFSILHGILPIAMEIDQAFIAAVLTVIGYSINDTVVVFDRIREFMNQYTGWSKEEIINKAIDSTVSRTVITSLTTLFMVFMLFVFSSGSIKGFAFALLIGILVGTYSSIFVATPVFYDLSGDLKPKTSTQKKKKGGFRRTATTS